MGARSTLLVFDYRLEALYRCSNRSLFASQLKPNMVDLSRSLVSQKSSDSGLHVQLHPLVLLTISDHITRHAARSQQGPIVGALLGQQNGQDITLEHAFECSVSDSPSGEVILSQSWFEERVKQCANRLQIQRLSVELLMI